MSQRQLQQSPKSLHTQHLDGNHDFSTRALLGYPIPMCALSMSVGILVYLPTIQHLQWMDSDEDMPNLVSKG